MRPAGRPAIALERLDGRGLACPVRTEHDQDLAGAGLQREAVHGGRGVRRAVADGEVADYDGGHRVGGHGDAGYFEQA